MNKKRENVNRLISVFILIVFVNSIIPAQEINRQVKTAQEQLEIYLDRAARERSSERWQMIAQQGFLAAMTIWENSYLEKLDDS